jgi:phosphoglycerol geranylgeranyltransferase
MADAEGAVSDFLCDRSQPTRHAILIDPADQPPEVAAKRAIAAASAGSRMILVGGSSDTNMENVHATVLAIKEGLELVSWASSQDSGATEEDWRAPVILFPQGSTALSPAADAITFMMLMNSTDPRFLIGEQTLGAPFVKKANLEPIPMGYVICSPGGEAGEVGNADLILHNETDRVAAFAMTAECFGFTLFYLEAGSGAATPVDPELIRTAREACDLTIVVGGGIRDGKAARVAAQAGADWIITGNIVEEFDDADELQSALAALIQGMNGH